MGSVSMSMKERFDVSQPLTTGRSARGLGGLGKIATALHPLHRKCNLIFQHVVRMTLLLTREEPLSFPPMGSATESSCTCTAEQRCI